MLLIDLNMTLNLNSHGLYIVPPKRHHLNGDNYISTLMYL